MNYFIVKTILEGSINYPNELLKVIEHLSIAPRGDEGDQDAEMILVQTNVLAKFSFNNSVY